MPQGKAVQGVTRPAESTGKRITKRVVANALVAFFAVFCIGEAVALRSIPPIVSGGDVWGSLTQLVAAVILPVAGLLMTIRWSLRLGGWKTAGKQTWAIFLAGFCAVGFVFVAAVAIQQTASGTLRVSSVIVGLLYVAGSYVGLRWFWRLRRREREQQLAV